MEFKSKEMDIPDWLTGPAQLFLRRIIDLKGSIYLRLGAKI